MPAAYFVGDVQLMGNEIDAAADKSTYSTGTLVMAQDVGAIPQVECAKSIQLATEETVFRCIEADCVAQAGFRYAVSVAYVGNQVVDFLNVFNGKLLVAIRYDCLLYTSPSPRDS